MWWVVMLLDAFLFALSKMASVINKMIFIINKDFYYY